MNDKKAKLVMHNEQKNICTEEEYAIKGLSSIVYKAQLPLYPHFSRTFIFIRSENT